MEARKDAEQNDQELLHGQQQATVLSPNDSLGTASR